MPNTWQFDARRLLAPDPDKCPPGSERLVEVLYRASLYLEEGRELQCKVVLLPAAAQIPYMLRFSESEEITPQRIRKLGALADQGQACIVALAGENPSMAGLCSLRVAEVLLPRLNFPAPLLVSIRGRGQIRTDRAGETAIYSLDRYRMPSPTWLELARCIGSSIVEGLVKHVEPKTKRLTSEFSATHVRSADPTATVLHQQVQVLRALVNAVRDCRCGGAVLVVPNAQEDVARACISSHRLVAPAPDGPGEEWNGTILERLALSVLEPRHPSLQLNLEMPYVQHLLDTERYAQEEVTKTACLTRADGALILDWALLPLAVGAKLRVGGPVDLNPAVATFLKEGEKGMRHTSMAHAVNTLRGSLGIVVSADGDATLFANAHGPARTLEFVQ